MEMIEQKDDKFVFRGEVALDTSGRHFYSVRAMPYNKNLPHNLTPGLVAWEE